jgi:UDP-glucuronate 4-epimerase
VPIVPRYIYDLREGNMRDRRVLVTGATGQIAFPLAKELAKDNEVWGLARFSDPSKRETWSVGKYIKPATRDELEANGIRTAKVDIVNPDWSDLPDHFDHVLHLAVFQMLGLDYDYALSTNAEGTGLLMSRFRDAQSFLVLSTIGVYATPEIAGERIPETYPLGGEREPHSPTYSISKIAQEAVARTMARTLGVPTTIARMGLSYGANGGLPAYQLDMMLDGEPLYMPSNGTVVNPIHERDIADQATKLLEVATVPATIVNWVGDEEVGMEEYLRYLGEIVGVEPNIQYTGEAITGRVLDNTKRKSLIGDCSVDWRTGMREMVEGRHRDRVTAGPVNLRNG